MLRLLELPLCLFHTGPSDKKKKKVSLGDGS
jgi:hypothetical protein